MQLGRKILKFDVMEENTVKNFNTLFNFHQLIGYNDNLLVTILEPVTSYIREIQIGDEVIRHDFSHCTNEEVRNINHSKKMMGKGKGAGKRYEYYLTIEEEFIGKYSSTKEVAKELECDPSLVSYYINTNTNADTGIRIKKVKKDETKNIFQF